MEHQDALHRARTLLEERSHIVFMMCGVSGSGKTTFAQSLEALGCERLSIDEEIWDSYGRFGVDYPEGDYPQLRDAAEKRLRERLIAMLEDGTKAVIDFSFWSARTRESYRFLTHHKDHFCQLVFMNVPVEVLRQRLEKRASRRDANASFPITDDLLNRYVQGFETPSAEEDAWFVE